MVAFTNMRTGETCPNESALLVAILADATNLGLYRMAAASQGVTRDQLVLDPGRLLRIPMKPATDSDLKPASHSDFIPAGVPTHCDKNSNGNNHRC